MNALEIFGTIIMYCWGLLTFEVPGLNVTCQEFVQALILIKVSVAALRFVFGLDDSGSGYRSGGNGKRGISEKRKGDEK